MAGIVGKDTDYLTPDRVEERKEERRQKFGVDENEERGNWTGRFDFLLSCLGWAVGLGNVWRFPYLCYNNGGGAFLIPYFMMLFLCGIPLFFMELALGQFCSQGPLTCWKFAPIFKGIGIAQLILSMLVTIYYTMIIAWSFFYMCVSFTAMLPWSQCERNSTWTTGNCTDFWPNVTCAEDMQQPNGTCYVDSEFTGIYNFSVFDNVTGIKRQSASEQYFNNRMLRISGGIDEMGGVQWDLALCLLAVWTISFLCLIRGIKSSGKVVYFTAVFPYVILVILLVRGVTLPGSLNGISYFITPRWEHLKNSRLWYDAANQIFYSLGSASGGLMALASYNRFHNNCLRDALIVSIANCLTSVFAGFVIFSFIGFLAYQLEVDVANVTKHGTGLAFVIYPDAVSHMPVSPLWAVLFFFMLLTLGFDSQFVGLEVIVTAVVDQFTWLRTHKTKVTFGLCVLLFILGLPLCSNGGMYLLQLMDTYCGGWALFVIGFFECISIGYIYGANRFLQDIEVMIGWSWTFIWWKWCWLTITPSLILFVMIFFFFAYTPAKYDTYTYPPWADGLGWCMSLASIIWIPIVAVIKIFRHDGPLVYRLRLLTMPKAEWGPALIKHRELVKHVEGFVVDPWGSDAGPAGGVRDDPSNVYSINAISMAIAQAQNEANHAAQYQTNGISLTPGGESVLFHPNGNGQGQVLPDGSSINFSTI